jgi:hypothetical protein
MASRWDSVPIVTVFRAACPYCGSEAYTPVRSFQNGDGTSTKRASCDECSRLYVVVREPLPKFGDFITWPEIIRGDE